ncbi:CAP domain-containing protein [Sandaracinus amylolyticus]|uniref:CAP domain-containing protein n=1 Tax=Sandaracinus amylolyticus TaxID=927083 RepID=UPI001F475789|nr:CAP domain-containing protein [Sandaracinus amylolyticus]
MLPFLLLLTACGGDDERVSYDPDGEGPEPAVTLDCRDPESWPASWVAFEDEILAEVNARRAAGATCGGEDKPPVPPLAMDAALREAARCHSLDMAANGYFSHDSADGRSPWDRAMEASYAGFASGENIIAGHSTGAEAVAGWMDSPGHCNNIMADGPNDTGIGYAFIDGSPFGHYATELFGSHE